MRVHIFGAGASVDAGYPLASRLLHRLSEWLDSHDPSESWVRGARNRILQVRETFGSLDDFEGILRALGEYGRRRFKPTGPTTYYQDVVDLFEDYSEQWSHTNSDADLPDEGFYPQYLRSHLIAALREFFYST